MTEEGQFKGNVDASVRVSVKERTYTWEQPSSRTQRAPFLSSRQMPQEKFSALNAVEESVRLCATRREESGGRAGLIVLRSACGEIRTKTGGSIRKK